jgi:hypothetical protein
MSRIGGVFPFSQQMPANGDGVIALPSGGIYMLPPGNFLLQLGTQTQCQSFDPNQLNWRGVQAASGEFTYISSDGTNYRLVNLSGVVLGASITAVGSGGTNGIGATATGAAVTFAAPAAGGALATATAYPIVGGSVAAPTITQPGSGLLVPPLLMCDPPPVGGIQATAVATISSAGAVTAVTMVNVGAGYLSTPNWYVFPQPPNYQGQAIAGATTANAFPPPGLVYPTNLPAGSMFAGNISLTGVQLTSVALTGSGTLTGIGILNYGFGYSGTTIPAVTITGVGTAAATAIMSMAMISVTVTTAGAGYTGAAVPIWESSLGVVSNTFNNQIAQPRGARGVTTLSGGTVATFVIEDAGFGFQKVPVISVLDTTADNSTLAVGTAVVGGVTDTSVLQGRVQ